MTRATRFALAFLCAVVPLYGTFAELDPARPPLPELVPVWVPATIGIVVLGAFAVLMRPAWRAAGRDALTFGFLGGGFATILAALTGFDPPTGLGLGALVLAYGATGLVLARSADAAAVRLCTRAWLWSALVAAFAALALAAARRPAALYAYNNGRAVGTFLNPNELAAFALAGLAFAIPLAVRSRGRDGLAVAAGTVLAAALAATFSRWGALSAVIAALLAVFVSGAGRRARTLAGALVLVVAFGLAWDASGGRHHNPRDTEARAAAWRTGVVTFLRFPLLGTGPLAYARTYTVLRPPDAPGSRTPIAFDPHSLPLAFAASGGIIALLVLIACNVILMRALVLALPTGGALALGGFAAVAALDVHVLINTISIFFPLGLQAAGLGLAAARVARDGRA